MGMSEIWFRKGSILYNAGVFTHKSTFFDKICQKYAFIHQTIYACSDFFICLRFCSILDLTRGTLYNNRSSERGRNHECI